MTTERITATLAGLAAAASLAVGVADAAPSSTGSAAMRATTTCAARHGLRLAGHAGRGAFPAAVHQIIAADEIYPESLLKLGYCPVRRLRSTACSS